VTSVRAIARGQGAYHLLSGLWPVASMRTFEWVTGPKQEDWLVRTVGLLAAAIGGGTLLAERRGEARAVAPVAAGAAAAFAIVDIVGVASGRLRPVYLGDAVVEAGLLIGWLRSR
jgi:hypothetical protein